VLALGGGVAFGPARGVAQSKGVALLMFDDPGCPYCRKWHREVGPAYAKSDEGRRAPLRVLQIRDPRPGEIELISPVRATPTFVLVQDGREVGRLTGYGGEEFFWSMLGELMKKLKAGAQGA
jgi:thioredoxin-related protein